MSQACPKCSGENPVDAKSCALCGIVFVKFKERRMRPRPKMPRTPDRTNARLRFWEMKSLALFFGRLGKLLAAGLPLNQSLYDLKADGATGHLPEKLYPLIDQGYGLVESLRRSGAALPSFVWGHLEAGEASGHLPEMLKALADEIQLRRKRILLAIFNFRMLGFLVILVGASASLSITGAVRELSNADIHAGVSGVLSGIARGAIPRLFMNLWLFGGICSVGMWFQLVGKHDLTVRYAGFERLRFQLPIFSDVLIAESLVRYLDLMARLVNAGIPLGRALAIARGDLEFPHWAAQFEKVEETIHRGGELSEGFAQVPHLPKDMLVELRVGEKTGGLPEGMHRVSVQLKDQAERGRTIVMGIQAGLLFTAGLILSVYVIIRGMGAWIPLYERQF